MSWNLNDWATFSAIIIGSGGFGLSVWNAFFKDKPDFSMKAELVLPEKGKQGKTGVKIFVIGKNKTIYIDKIGYKFKDKTQWFSRDKYQLPDELPPGDSIHWQKPIDDIVQEFGEYPVKAMAKDKTGRIRKVDMPKTSK